MFIESWFRWIEGSFQLVCKVRNINIEFNRTGFFPPALSIIKVDERHQFQLTYLQKQLLFNVDLEFSSSIPGLFQTWNSNTPGFEKLNSRSGPGFEKLNSRSEPGFEKLNSRSELELSKKTIINWEKSSKPGFDCWVL